MFSFVQTVIAFLVTIGILVTFHEFEILANSCALGVSIKMTCMHSYLYPQPGRLSARRRGTNNALVGMVVPLP